MASENKGVGVSTHLYDSKSFTIGIVDNDRLSLMALATLIERYLEECRILWKVVDGRSAVDLCLSARSRPDVLIVDMSLEGMSGLSVCRQVRAATDRVAILGVTSFSLEMYRYSAREAGAQGLIGKEDIEKICEAIVSLANGRIADAAFSETAIESHRRLTADGDEPLRCRSLSRREMEVMDLSVCGKSRKAIAKELGIGETSIRTLQERAFKKLGARNKTEAVVAWLSFRNE
ncbi:response regulator transcription factor [Bifidobacterium callimiconis]|uniref:DNA-binding response regulator n=1 Tax=Bifidobacterium callimiconis TaxID=2306973 RepID=A0A430FC64_9BIFI|nr:response regulator transcription factor [Bifidobacterium callimiconis]RSX50382.1 DNA-binding response regulator [Bifidobacterium callimiconis]